MLSALVLSTAMASTPASVIPPESPPANAAATAATTRTRIGHGTTDLVQVLDINLQTQTAVLKVVYHLDLEDEMGEPAGSVDCGYAGMEEMPRSGVTLALFKLGENAVETFDIYPLAMNASECASHEASTATLERARAAFEAAGLDTARRPAPVVPARNGQYSFSVNGTATQVGAWAVQQDNEADPMTAIRESGLFHGEQILYVERTSFNLVGAGSMQVTFPLAWVQDDQAVFLVHSVSSDMRSPTSEQWHLTSSVPLR